jgi:hypothetical protein
MRMKDLMNIGLHNHMSSVLNADLLVIDNTVYKDRTGKHGGVGANPRILIPADEIDKVRVEDNEAGTILSYDGSQGKIILITTQPIKFQEIK